MEGQEPVPLPSPNHGGRVKQLITRHPELGYVTVKEFVQNSVRRRVEQTLRLMKYEELDRR